jgi:hypothetical protein
MKLTNRLNLPEPIVEAVRNDGYSRGDSDISVTSLLKPPQMTALEYFHEDEIEEDASDRIYSLLGQSIHTILERANQTGIAERRMSIEIEGWKVSGGMDLVCKDRVLSDYKTVTVYKFKGGQAPIEYVQQLNCYAAILRAHGEEVKSAQIVAILRDWSKLEARRDPAYPQSQVIVVPVTLWPALEAQVFLRERVLAHQQARKTLPECSAEDRWERPTKYALMKQGGKRAVKLYDSQADALVHAATNPALYVQDRPGESIRCAAYCSVSKWCGQFNKKSANQIQELEEIIA